MFRASATALDALRATLRARAWPGGAATASKETRGLWLGLLGVVIFSLTLPMTRLAVGPAEAPQLAPVFVTVGRAAVAGLLSLLWLLLTRAPMPQRDQASAILGCALGTVVGFPLFLALALRQVPSAHGAVVTGVLPLVTAVAAALMLRQRPSVGFWVSAVAGCALVLGFAAWRGGGALHLADALLLAAISCAAVGYVFGARLATRMSAERVICWVLVCSLPITLPATLLAWPDSFSQIGASAWVGFAYVSLFSMWIGFFAWYRGLALGGTMRVSQVQLVQPFLSLLFAVPLVGETLDVVTVAFALAVIATVFVAKRMPVGMPAR